MEDYTKQLEKALNSMSQEERENLDKEISKIGSENAVSVEEYLQMLMNCSND